MGGLVDPYRNPSSMAHTLAGDFGHEAEAVSFDIENPDRARISLIGFASTNGLVASAPWDMGTRARSREILAEGQYDLVAHNAQYDVMHLDLEGVEVDESRLRDTMLAAMLLQPDLPKGLGSVAQRYMFLEPWKHRADSDMSVYNAMDAEITLKIWLVMKEDLKANGQWDFFVNAMMPGSMVLRRMTERGIKVSDETMEIWRETLEQELLDLNGEWSELTNGVNPASPKQLGEYLYEREELPILERTRTGAPSTSAGTLAKLAARTDHRALQLLLEIRKRSKQLGTYAKDQGVGPDGCVHPQYLPAGKDDGAFGTASLRLAARDPNIQNQPPEARFMYVPHLPGWVIGESDFSQIEGRLVAILARDDELILGYDQGTDIHQLNADLWGVPRKKAKNILYAMSYGAGVRKLMQQFEVKQSVAKGWLEAYREAHPRVWEWQQEMIRRAATYGYLQNPFGIRRYFPGLARDDKHVKNQATNFMPQSIVAGITWSLLHQMEQVVEDAGGYLLTQVHDSFVWEAPADKAEDVAAVVKNVMEQPWPQLDNWSCPTDVSVGETWGHAVANEKEADNGESGLEVWIKKGRPALSEV